MSKMQIEPRSDGDDVIAVFVRDCGHTERLVYGAERFALLDTEQQSYTLCLVCRNKATNFSVE